MKSVPVIVLALVYIFSPMKEVQEFTWVPILWLLHVIVKGATLNCKINISVNPRISKFTLI
jgi:hypothetical protein